MRSLFHCRLRRASRAPHNDRRWSRTPRLSSLEPILLEFASSTRPARPHSLGLKYPGSFARRSAIAHLAPRQLRFQPLHRVHLRCRSKPRASTRCSSISRLLQALKLKISAKFDVLFKRDRLVSFVGDVKSGLTTAFQPRRLMIAPAAVGCKRLLDRPAK